MMHPPKANPSDPAKAKSPHARSWQIGRTAFKLIGKHQTSADPKSYAVWYEYAAKNNAELTAEVNLILALERGISIAEMGQLYDKYFAENTQSDAELDDISRAIETKVAGAKSLVTEVISNTSEYVSTMEKAKRRLPKATSPDEIMEALDELVEETRNSQESTETIQIALQCTHDEITVLNSKVGEFRESLKRDRLTKLLNQQQFETLLGDSSAEALKNGYSLTVMVVCIKNLQDLCLTAGTDISEFALKSLSSFMTKIVDEDGACARLAGTEMAILLPKSAYAEAAKIAREIIDELDHFKIVKKPSDELIGYIKCVFGGAALQAGLSPQDLIRIASEQASQAKFANKSTVKFNLANHQAA